LRGWRLARRERGGQAGEDRDDDWYAGGRRLEDDLQGGDEEDGLNTLSHVQEAVDGGNKACLLPFAKSHVLFCIQAFTE
jgi:hypothetical protein